MTLMEQIDALDRVLDLIHRVKDGAEFLHDDEVLQKLQWTAKNIADDIWHLHVTEPRE